MEITTYKVNNGYKCILEKEDRVCIGYGETEEEAHNDALLKLETSFINRKGPGIWEGKPKNK